VVTKLSRMLISGELTSGTTVHIEAHDSEDDSLDDCNIPVAKKSKTLHYRVHHADPLDEQMDVNSENNWEMES